MTLDLKLGAIAAARAMKAAREQTARRWNDAAGVPSKFMSWEKDGHIWLAQARAAITAYEKALSDAGLVVVPRDPTEAMLQAADPTMGNLGWRWEQMAGFWRRMISASPAPRNTTGKDE